jgi:hypothetical protein
MAIGRIGLIFNQKEIYSHYVYECFTFAYRYLDQNRELLILC